MITVYSLDAMPMSSVGGVLESMVPRYRGGPIQYWNSRYFLLSVTLSESLTLSHASPDAACSLAVGAKVVGNYLTTTCDGKHRKVS